MPAPARSFADKLISERPHLVHKVKAKDMTGRWAYYFVMVEPPREKVFLAALKADRSIDLADYGKIIASCYGEEPNERVKQLLKDRYGFEV